MEEQLRNNILEKVKELSELIHRTDEFIPGTTMVPVSGRVFDYKDVQRGVNAVLDFWLTAGKEADMFEHSLSKLIGVRKSYLVNSGSSANLLAVKALTEFRKNSSNIVITTALGFPTTLSAITHSNMIPFLVDSDPQTYSVNIDSLKQAVYNNKPSIIILAHTLGNPFNLKEVTEIANNNDILLVEDCCDALYSKYMNIPVGSFGDASTFSFYPAHHITMGEGGAVCTKDVAVGKAIASYRDWGRDCWCKPGYENTCGKRFEQQFGELEHGFDHKYVYTREGFNLKATDIQAAIGNSQLSKLREFTAARKRNFEIITQELQQEKELRLPIATENSEPNWFGYPIMLPDHINLREFTKKLHQLKVDTRLMFGGNLLRQPMATGKNWLHGNLDSTDQIAKRTFWIGVYPGITEEMIGYTTDCIKKTLKDQRK